MRGGTIHNAFLYTGNLRGTTVMMMALGGMPEECSNACVCTVYGLSLTCIQCCDQVTRVTREWSHQSVLYYSYSVYSITYSPQNVSSDLQYTNH